MWLGDHHPDVHLHHSDNAILVDMVSQGGSCNARLSLIYTIIVIKMLSRQSPKCSHAFHSESSGMLY